MAKKLTITNTRPSYQTLWYFETNPPQNNTLREWVQNNSDKVTFQFDISNGGNTQILEYTFADDAVAEEFSNLFSSNIPLVDEYHASVGITSTTTITDV
jgi:hypothetical protein